MHDSARRARLRRSVAASARDPRAWLAAYVTALALIAFWPAPVDSGAGPLLRAVEKLFPVLTYERIEFGANVVMFIPLGYLLTLIVRRERWLVLPISLLATVAIESGQAVALSARTPSVLDIIANTAGACVGMLLAVLTEVLARSRTPAPAHVEVDVTRDGPGGRLVPQDPPAA